MARLIKEVDPERVTHLYVAENMTLRNVAAALGTNHHRIRRILEAEGVTIHRQKPRAPFTDEHRRKISEATKGRASWITGLKMDEATRRRQMKARIGTTMDFSVYPDYAKLLFLSRLFSKRQNELGKGDESRKVFLDHFYPDRAFNAIFDAWKLRDENKWWYPSLDHIHPKAGGGSWALDNLRFITWFENRAKAEMPSDAWETFKKDTGTRSDLFIENILL